MTQKFGTTLKAAYLGQFSTKLNEIFLKVVQSIANKNTNQHSIYPPMALRTAFKRFKNFEAILHSLFPRFFVRSAVKDRFKGFGLLYGIAQTLPFLINKNKKKATRQRTKIIDRE